MNILPRLTVALVALLLSPACADSTGPDASHVGVYHLRTVNGDPLPFTLVQLGSERVEVTGGLIILNADGTFTDRTTFRVTEAAGSRVEETGVTGTYITNGSVVQLTPTGAARYSVAVSDNRRLMQTVESFVLVYTK